MNQPPYPIQLILYPSGDIATPEAVALFQFIADKHGSQRRKYTREPYTNHLVTVAENVWLHTADHNAVAAALAHDVLEDTPCTITELHNALTNTGYTNAAAITALVIDLTDVYTTEAYPALSRSERKAREHERMRTIAPLAQTIKYCDVMDNAVSICEHDNGFAVTYLREVTHLLDILREGNPATRSAARALMADLMERYSIRL